MARRHSFMLGSSLIIGQVPATADESLDQLLWKKGEGPPPAVLNPGPAFVRSAPDAVKRLWKPAARVDDNEFALDLSYEELSARYVFPQLGRSAGPAAGRHRHLPGGCRFVIDRISDGIEACGIVWHIEKPGEDGIAIVERGLTFVRLDKDGRVCYVREIGEPMDKAGLSSDEFVQLLSGSAGKAPPMSDVPYEPFEDAPRTAKDIVMYLFGPTGSNKASTADKKLGVDTRIFSDDVIYEDMNYEQPFVGRAALEQFLGRFQTTEKSIIRKATFEVEDTSDGDKAVCFVYLIRLPGLYKAIKGVSYLELNDQGRVSYVRDIPLKSDSPTPLQLNAQRFDGGGLRRYNLGGDARQGGVGRFGD